MSCAIYSRKSLLNYERKKLTKQLNVKMHTFQNQRCLHLLRRNAQHAAQIARKKTHQHQSRVLNPVILTHKVKKQCQHKTR